MSKKILLAIAPDQFRDEELLEPRNVFINEGWDIDTASTQTGSAKGMLGAVEEVSLTFDDIKDNAYDAVVVVGGMGSVEHLWNNATLHNILKKTADNNKVISAICLSGAVLAKAGLLQGKKATVWEMDESVAALKDGGAEYTGQPVTVDGNIVTANGPEAATDFGKAIAERVKSLVTA